MNPGPGRISPLTTIKLLHTLVWAFFAVCIVAIPIAGALDRYRAALVLSGITMIERLVLWRSG